MERCPVEAILYIKISTEIVQIFHNYLRILRLLVVEIDEDVEWCVSRYLVDSIWANLVRQDDTNLLHLQLRHC